jgi:hypothetical protein
MVDRVRRDGPDPLLHWKVRLFFAGAAVLLLSIVLDRKPLALAAIALLGVAMLVVVTDRFRRRDARFVENEDEAGDAAP